MNVVLFYAMEHIMPMWTGLKQPICLFSMFLRVDKGRLTLESNALPQDCLCLWHTEAWTQLRSLLFQCLSYTIVKVFKRGNIFPAKVESAFGFTCAFWKDVAPPRL